MHVVRSGVTSLQRLGILDIINECADHEQGILHLII